MQEMPKAIIADTSCFIALDNIGELALLQKIYGQVITTPEVQNEFGKQLHHWVKLQSPEDITKQRILEINLDKGEASAIALALEIHDSTIILDDYKARRIAENLGLAITGTLGVIIKAKQQNIVSSVKPFLQKMKKAGFHLSPEFEKNVLREAGE